MGSKASDKPAGNAAQRSTLSALVPLPGDHGPRVEVTVGTGRGGRRRVNTLAAGEIEGAILRTGETVERAGEVVEIVARVNRRPGSPLLAALDRPAREAAALYALAVEIVTAGGLGGGAFGEARVDGGRGVSEGAQARALDWAEQLRAFDAAIGVEAVRLTAKGDAITVRALIRAIVVGGLSIPRVLASLGLKRSAPRERALRKAALAAFARMAGVGSGARPMREENFR